MPKTIMHIAEAAGGVERYLVSLLKKIRKYNEYEHIVVCSEYFDTGKFSGIVKELICIPELKNAISFSHDSKAVYQVRRVIKSHKPDVVYCHSSKAGAVGRLAAIGCHCKVLYNAHGWAFNMRGISTAKRILYQSVEKALAPLTDRIICISEYEKKSAIAHRICSKKKLSVIYNGIDFDEYRDILPKAKDEFGIPDNAFVVGAVGRLTQQKSPDIFVKMASEIKRKIPEAFFLMVGDGIQRAEIEEQICKHRLRDSFCITGWVDNPLDYASCFDVSVLLSRWEGFGLVLPEYMLLGKPIIATSVDAIPEVVGEAGILVAPNDPVSAADAVIQVYHDDQLRNEMVARGKRRVEFFNMQRTADETIRLFE